MHTQQSTHFGPTCELCRHAGRRIHLDRHRVEARQAVERRLCRQHAALHGGVRALDLGNVDEAGAAADQGAAREVELGHGLGAACKRVHASRVVPAIKECTALLFIPTKPPSVLGTLKHTIPPPLSHLSLSHATLRPLPASILRPPFLLPSPPSHLGPPPRPPSFSALAPYAMQVPP
jgi:hypothetical protein